MIVSTLVTEFGKKAAERWLTLVAVPGLVFTSLAGIGFLLGDSRWFDFGAVAIRLAKWASTDPGGGTTTTLLVAIFVVAAAAAAGFTAQALGAAVLHLFAGQWSRLGEPLASRLTARRAQKWKRLDDAYQRAYQRAYQDGAEGDVLTGTANRRNRMALSTPIRPTWTGDRLSVPAERVRQQYGFDLVTAWPRLWLLLPGSAQESLAVARARLHSAVTLGGWAVLYLALGARWWPSAVIGVVLALVSWRRTRAEADAYSELVEAAFDVHVVDLVRQCTPDPENPPAGRQQGLELTERFRKST